jgi:cysteine desulfurase
MAENSVLTNIYLDYQASTPLDNRVLEEMLPYMTTEFGNPHSSEHAFGWKANNAVENAKESISSYIDALSDEIIFTSGATEANNLAIVGIGYAALEKSERRTILVSSIEHKCVLGAARFLERFGFNVKKIPVLADGKIDLNSLAQLLKDDVLLVSVMATNNEIGVNQDLSVIGNLCKQHGIIFHVDAAQGGYANINVIENNIDLMSLSAHKIYGPKGIGVLYINQALDIKPLPIIHGGGQQDGYRSGTLPVYLAVGMAKAINLISELKEAEKQRIITLRNKMLDGLKAIVPELKVNGTMEDRHPGNINIMLPHKDARQLILSVQPNLAFSTGSACTSGIQEPSHVLKAIGLSTTEAEQSFRMTIGRFTNEGDVTTALQILSEKLK